MGKGSDLHSSRFFVLRFQLARSPYVVGVSAEHGDYISLGFRDGGVQACRKAQPDSQPVSAHLFHFCCDRSSNDLHNDNTINVARSVI